MFELRREATEAGVPNWYLGLTAGQQIELPGEEPLAIAELRQAHESWLPDYMAGRNEGPAAEAA